ncbi:hypothetical protein GCM10007421_30350 [Halopseudomonas oceani]|uniref:DUF1302 domain-containing protein n=1 Tax=Halopseudomonas oceani TaxID=1708783 RepID=A0A2P4ESG3_9GAMM|nr:DUF1302 domain-containing protein [Halopseudomonas oceani]POB01965.1 DUF1302 domain-containing protein [Halopseudomonas oceani]GGE53819.1 hypothetical protein GCM10007421_30350 [Halopseudomonas oceani]
MTSIANNIMHSRNWLGKTALALTPLACVISLQANAGQFEWGEISGRANGSISTGVIWSAESPNRDLILQGNADHNGYGSAGEFNPTGARNADDSRLNYQKGDRVSSPTTLLGEVELNWHNYGVFMRAKAWYDYTLENSTVAHGHSPNGYNPDSKLDDSHFDELAKFHGVELLDAYVFGDFEIAERPLHLRAGNQVVNWGEGLFFQNGLNSINPVDVAALRRPGSQLKEALLPVPLLYANFGLTDALSIEAFYQLQWRQSVLEGCGTYFAVNDYLPEGCYGIGRGTLAQNPNDQVGYANDFIVHRAEDDEARDGGQFGLAARYYAESLATEISAYAMNIHSRIPVANVITDRRTEVGAGWIAGQQASNGAYYAAFPEDIRIFGLSVSTTLLGSSVFGEYSYRPNQPVRLHAGDLIPAFSGNPTAIVGLGAPLADEAIALAPDSRFNGYDRLEISQLSLGFIKTVPRLLGADNLSLVGEVAAKYIHNLPSLDERRYGRADAFGSNLAANQGLGSVGCTLGVAPQYRKKVCSNDGFVTDLSWGYRLRAQLNYPGLFAGINVSPFVAFGQDVKGTSHDGNFIEGRLLGSVGVRAAYLQKYSAELSWSGSGNAFWAPTDKDFIALSLRAGF